MRFHWGRGYRDHHDRRNLLEVVCYLVTFGILYISILWFGAHSLAHTYLEQIVCKMGFSRYQQESYFRFISSHQDDWQKTPMVIWFDTFTHFLPPKNESVYLALCCSKPLWLSFRYNVPDVFVHIVNGALALKKEVQKRSSPYDLNIMYNTFVWHWTHDQ